MPVGVEGRETKVLERLQWVLINRLERILQLDIHRIKWIAEGRRRIALESRNGDYQ